MMYVFIGGVLVIVLGAFFIAGCDPYSIPTWRRRKD